ncbi:hypothetical protein L6164_013149 [Bauhinia variegata]|uniref:Uncharacterized protein n=1 Tax=Bauhinia variegata TaxID=167791 RepID=A0ACB9PDE2_BAUVA|nr:hypothetical protein L6164_013149 [Bauhinia variegata]
MLLSGNHQHESMILLAIRFHIQSVSKQLCREEIERQMCPASSSRWCPTPEQLMILEKMYRNGVRTPNASQIQHITAYLSFYGKIEGKNVFYWFQYHKTRD